MFLGHYGVAFALKRAEPKVSLGTLFVAVQLADVLWGCFLLLGWEQVRIDPTAGPVAPLEFVHYPISHSLVGSLAWALAAGALYYSWPTRDTSRHWQAAVLVAAAAASHWFLDAIVHFPDLPLGGDGSPQIGFGLWGNLPLTIALELLVLGGGVAVYVVRRSHRHPARAGRLVGNQQRRRAEHSVQRRKQNDIARSRVVSSSRTGCDSCIADSTLACAN